MEEGGTYGRDSSALSGTALDHVRVLLRGQGSEAEPRTVQVPYAALLNVYWQHAILPQFTCVQCLCGFTSDVRSAVEENKPVEKSKS